MTLRLIYVLLSVGCLTLGANTRIEDIGQVIHAYYALESTLWTSFMHLYWCYTCEQHRKSVDIEHLKRAVGSSVFYGAKFTGEKNNQGPVSNSGCLTLLLIVHMQDQDIARSEPWSK